FRASRRRAADRVEGRERHDGDDHAPGRAGGRRRSRVERGRGGTWTRRARLGCAMSEASSGMGLSILVVDDDDVFRRRLARAFRDRGYDAREASGYDEAIASARSDSPELAV